MIFQGTPERTRAKVGMKTMNKHETHEAMN